MMYYICFSVEPKVGSPRYYEIQAGWAHCLVQMPMPEAELLARMAVEAKGFEIQKLHIATEQTPESLALIPPESKAFFAQNPTAPIYIEIVYYDIGGGAQEAPNPFSEDDET